MKEQQKKGKKKTGEVIANEDDLDNMMWDNDHPADKGLPWKQKKGKAKESKGECPECGTKSENEVDEYCLNCGASFDENNNVSEAVNQLHTDDFTFPKSWDQDKIDYEAKMRLSDDLDMIQGKSVIDRHPLSWQVGYEKEENLSNVVDRVNKKHEPEGGWDESDYVGEATDDFDVNIEPNGEITQDLPTDKRSHDVESKKMDAGSDMTDNGSDNPNDGYMDETFDPMNPNAGEAWANESGWFECQDCKFFSTNQEDADGHKATGHNVGSFGFDSVMPYSKGNTV